MNPRLRWSLLLSGLFLTQISPVCAATIQFSGFEWSVRSGRGGPGPNTLENDQATHRFTWGETRVLFQSLQGHRNDDLSEFGRWVYSPEDAPRRISQKPMPVHINLWLFRGHPPKNGQEVEVIVRSFEFTPDS